MFGKMKDKLPKLGAKTNLGGSTPPEKPKAKHTPPPGKSSFGGKGLAIGENPESKASKKIEKMMKGKK